MLLASDTGCGCGCSCRGHFVDVDALLVAAYMAAGNCALLFCHLSTMRNWTCVSCSKASKGMVEDA